MYIEIIGYIASVFVLISFLWTDNVKIRITNTIGCAFWVGYGFLGQHWPVLFMNAMVMLVNIVRIIQETRKSKQAESQANNADVNASSTDAVSISNTSNTDINAPDGDTPNLNGNAASAVRTDAAPPKES